jgi:hypothetical protein
LEIQTGAKANIDKRFRLPTAILSSTTIKVHLEIIQDGPPPSEMLPLLQEQGALASPRRDEPSEAEMSP